MSWENRMFIQDYAWENRMFIQDYAWECLEKIECSFKTMLEKIECSFKTMLDFVDGDVLIYKGRLTDLKMFRSWSWSWQIILTVYLDCLSRLYPGRLSRLYPGRLSRLFISAVSWLSRRSFCRLVTVRSKSWERIKYSYYIFNIEAWVHTPSQLNTLQRLNRLQTLL